MTALWLSFPRSAWERFWDALRPAPIPEEIGMKRLERRNIWTACGSIRNKTRIHPGRRNGS